MDQTKVSFRQRRAVTAHGTQISKHKTVRAAYYSRARNRFSQTRAATHSRRTLISDTPSTSAVSFAVRPPKKRSSTTRLDCGSSLANSLSASSSMTKSSLRCVTGRTDSSSDTGLRPFPRLILKWYRALCTRIWRIARAAAPRKWFRPCHVYPPEPTRCRKASCTSAVGWSVGPVRKS